ncbi:hypothetical protein GMSM_17290 [Geomonas sp. Red276]
MLLDPAKEEYLQQIVQNGLCVGCGMCQGLFGSDTVQLARNNYAYFTPVQCAPLTREQRVLLSTVCPGVSLAGNREAAAEHPIWGACRESLFAHAADPEVRFSGSSGGVITAVAIRLLESGAADFIVQIGVSAHDPLVNEVKISRTRGEVLANAGSRYAPSAPLSTIGELLDGPGRFAFIGKPCDVASLRQLGRTDPRVGEKVVLMLSFMCAGVPTLRGTREILNRWGIRPEEVESFRYRGEGWPGFTKAVLKDGSNRTMTYEDSWGSILNRHLLFRCKICPDGSGERADLVGADAWEGRPDGYPDFGEREGRSLVLARTERGAAVLKECLESGALISSGEVPVAGISAMQPYQAHRKASILSRLLAMKALGHYVPDYDRNAILCAARRNSLFDHFKSFLGMFKRELARKKAVAVGPEGR